VGNMLESPTSRRIRAAVLTPTPGIDVRTWAEGVFLGDQIPI
jgi:hypothetical protein